MRAWKRPILSSCQTFHIISFLCRIVISPYTHLFLGIFSSKFVEIKIYTWKRVDGWSWQDWNSRKDTISVICVVMRSIAAIKVLFHGAWMTEGSTIIRSNRVWDTSANAPHSKLWYYIRISNKVIINVSHQHNRRTEITPNCQDDANFDLPYFVRFSPTSLERGHTRSHRWLTCDSCELYWCTLRKIFGHNLIKGFQFYNTSILLIQSRSWPERGQNLRTNVRFGNWGNEKKLLTVGISSVGPQSNENNLPRASLPLQGKRRPCCRGCWCCWAPEKQLHIPRETQPKSTCSLQNPLRSERRPRSPSRFLPMSCGYGRSLYDRRCHEAMMRPEHSTSNENLVSTTVCEGEVFEAQIENESEKLA